MVKSRTAYFHMVLISFGSIIILCGAATQQKATSKQGQQAAPRRQAPPPTPPPTPAPIVPPPMRQCNCDELDECYNEQKTQQNNLETRCRQECGAAFLPNGTADKVAKCYEDYEQAKGQKKTDRQQCVENLIGRSCLTADQHQNGGNPQQLTLTIENPTNIIQHRQKRNYKAVYGNELNLYNACVKTCRKNRGVVQFNPDGTPVKSQHGGANSAAGGNNNQQQNGGFASCASRLNCQLPPPDKKLYKQAKDVCKYQRQHVDDDVGLKLCTCLETAVNRIFPCVPPAPINPGEANTCSSGSASCSGQQQQN